MWEGHALTGEFSSRVCLQGVVTDASPQTVAPSSQEVTGQQVDSAADHVPAYSYQSK